MIDIGYDDKQTTISQESERRWLFFNDNIYSNVFTEPPSKIMLNRILWFLEFSNHVDEQQILVSSMNQLSIMSFFLDKLQPTMPLKACLFIPGQTFVTTAANLWHS